ncbi:MAG TPA: nucleotidyltransferase domain-containing protein [Candidatus Lokiarchaeia archaeon]|nr:nucleotidyltransferase domain-containing protein [Candidatus Lokiarchaeia archaeon]
MEQYRAAWQQRFAERRNQLEERKAELQEWARTCVQVLTEQFHVTAAYLIGSLAGPYPINEHSDIDLVVEGLKDEDYFHALSAIYKKLPRTIEVDLIPYEDVMLNIREEVSLRGVKLL